jgi:hypothetical protein
MPVSEPFQSTCFSTQKMDSAGVRLWALNSFLSRILKFLVWDRLYRNPCVSFCVSVYLLCVFSVFRIVNATSTEASSSCTVRTAGQVHYKCTVYRGWNRQPYNCSKQSVCSPVPRVCMRVLDSC